jgi:hypothetical protein
LRIEIFANDERPTAVFGVKIFSTVGSTFPVTW